MVSLSHLDLHVCMHADDALTAAVAATWAKRAERETWYVDVILLLI